MAKKEEQIVIGSREIEKKIKEGGIEKVIVARNCPDKIIKKLSGVEIEKFSGDEKQLGIKIGKPFPVAVVGYLKPSK